MPITILFDLDDTLLSLKVEVFIPAYIQSLASSIPQAPSGQLISALGDASAKMVRKSIPVGTLETTFDRHFYPAIGLSKEQLTPAIDLFYKEIYPSLQSTTGLRPGMVEIVNHLLSIGHKIVVATNPLFPKTAVYQRLDWAGLEDFTHQFCIVTSYESFHFSKPHPEYFTEILAQLGWPDGPAVMVGNSFKDDITPAQGIGIPTFHLTEISHADSPFRKHPLSQEGNSDQILPWLKTITSSMGPDPINLSPAGLICALRVTPAAIDTIVKSIDSGHEKQIISLIIPSILRDFEILSDPDGLVNHFESVHSVCMAFFEIREKFIKQISNLSMDMNTQEIFESDKKLLRALISLRT